MFELKRDSTHPLNQILSFVFVLFNVPKNLGLTTVPIEIIGLESSLCHVIGVHYVKSKW